MCRHGEAKAMTAKSVALFAHPVERELSHQMARDALILANALLVREHRLLLHAPPAVLVPLLFGAEVRRAQIVVESDERAPAPIAVMPADGGDDPEAILFEGVRLSEDEEAPPVSLFGQLVALGYIDDRWLRDERLNPMEVLHSEHPEAIVAMGWSKEMAELCEAAEAFSEDTGALLIVGGTQRQAFVERPRWQAIEELELMQDVPSPQSTPEDLEGPESEGPSIPLSDAFREAWREAQRQAHLVMLAEALAGER